MQNIRRPHPSPVPVAPSHAGDVLERVLAIAAAPLLPGEEQDDYAALAERIIHASRPRDAIEEFLIRDVVDLTWEILRLRRAKNGILRASMGAGVNGVLASLGHEFFESKQLSKDWAAGDRNARKDVVAILRKAGLTMGEVTAETLDRKIDSFERLDRMLGSSEARRNNALREIDRHREAVSGAVRKSIEEIEDADFRDVDTGQVTTGTGP